MTKRLILMRHAKSGWDDPTLDDHERTLTDRGKRGALAIGKWLAANEFAPDVVLSSTSTRTRETLNGLVESIGEQVVEFQDSLYLAPPGRMLARLQERAEQTVLMLAHNPGTAALAEGLVKGAVEHARFRQHPSASTTVLEFDLECWRDIQPSSGQLIGFVTPADLQV